MAAAGVRPRRFGGVLHLAGRPCRLPAVLVVVVAVTTRQQPQAGSVVSVVARLPVLEQIRRILGAVLEARRPPGVLVVSAPMAVPRPMAVGRGRLGHRFRGVLGLTGIQLPPATAERQTAVP